MSASPAAEQLPVEVNDDQLKTINMFGVRIHSLNMKQALSQVQQWLRSDSEKCRYVVTPNVDHAVLLQENTDLQQAYSRADLVLADGHPIVWASRILKKPLPERVPGSDLVPKLFASLDSTGEPGMTENSSGSNPKPVSVFLLGAAPGVGLKAAANITQQHDNIEIVGVYSPPMGFENDPDETEIILGRIALTKPDLLVVGLGAPKQEVWVHQHCDKIQAKVALCVGATIDFLAGEKRRAPRWMQKSGIEWLHRMMSEPKRLVKRYAKDAWVFPQLVLGQWRRDAGK